MPFFQTKLRPEDFVVTELLQQDPPGVGDYHYILIEKVGLTTFLFLELMMKDFGLNRNMIGIAGLKDKHAITRQWISISKRDVAKYIGGVNDFLDRMRKKGKVIKATYGERMLKLGDNAGNQFELLLVPAYALVPELKKQIETFLKSVEKTGVPNYFGEQRFGYGGTNWKIGFDLLSGTIRNIKGDKNTLTEKRFKVQAFASFVFNAYLKEREKKGLLYTKIPGDVMTKDKTVVTGPVPGDDLTGATGEAGELEQAVFKRVGLTDDVMKRFKTYGLFGIRRPIVLFPHGMQFAWRGKNLFLSFSLPSGAYATVIIDQIEKLLASSEHAKTLMPKAPIPGKGKKPLAAPLKDAPKKPKDPTINPYTGQKINQDKAKTRAARALKKKTRMEAKAKRDAEKK